MIVESQQLRDVRADHEDQTIAFRIGCYDILHSEHQESIDFTAEQADIVAVGIMPDAYIRKQKGRSPIHSAEHRLAAMTEAEGVDIGFIIPNMGSLAVVKTLLRLQPDVYVEGNEHGARLSRALLLSAMGISYVVDNRGRTVSSTEIIAKFGRAEAARLSSLDFHPAADIKPNEFQSDGPQSLAA